MSQLAWAEISLDAIRHNFQYLAKQAAPGKLMAVIKADAYGHGSQAIAEALSAQCEMFAVARIKEAIALKDAGIQHDITVLSGCITTEHFTLCAQHKLIPCVYNLTGLAAAKAVNKPLNIWLKVDTGMHRLGLDNNELKIALNNPHEQLTVFGIMSHLACADTPSVQKNKSQHEEFNKLFKQYGLKNSSINNSASLLEKNNTKHNWHRAGIALYGINPKGKEKLTDLKPAMQLKSRVIHIQKINKGETVGYGETWQAKKESTIATIAIGYADGYPRHAKNGTPVMINQQHFPLAGRVSMDLITVDISDAKSEVKIGEEVTLWGEGLPCEIIAEHCQSIAYELLSQVNKRVVRAYT